MRRTRDRGESFERHIRATSILSACGCRCVSASVTATSPWRASPKPTFSRSALPRLTGSRITRHRGSPAIAAMLRQGTRKFGPEPTAESRLTAIDDLPRLERMADRMLDAVSWDDLLATE